MQDLDTHVVTADAELEATIFYLTAFGYVDGDFDPAEKAYITDYVNGLVAERFSGADTATASAHFAEVVDRVDQEIAQMWDEPVGPHEDATDYVRARLKLRCFEVFRGFERDTQARLMDAVDELLMADGIAHPEELALRRELVAILEADGSLHQAPPPVPPGLGPVPSLSPPAPPLPQRKPRGTSADRKQRPGRVTMSHATTRTAEGRNHPALTRLEHHYSADPELLKRQIEGDRALLAQVSTLLDHRRIRHDGKLVGHQRVDAFAGQPEFLDGHVHVLPPTHAKGYELTVLGDLHGCYSCLKGALMQSDFLGKVERFKQDPAAHPEPKLVLLGDYIDRGRYSYNGVLRTILRLCVAAPEHVYVLRGNHEYYLEHKGDVYGGVKPAEAINSLKPHVEIDVFKDYLRFFEKLPNTLLFDKMLFVHGGLARDAVLRERYVDLSSLNDPDIRFQMMWSDPSTVAFVPDALQAQSSRFPFGKQQARAFLHRMGLNTLVRGHQMHESGLERIYDDPDLLLLSLFSAGGDTNDDLPLFSNYRFVTPMALTIRRDSAGHIDVEPWAIDYATYVDPDTNLFYKSKAVIAQAGA